MRIRFVSDLGGPRLPKADVLIATAWKTAELLRHARGEILRLHTFEPRNLLNGSGGTAPPTPISNLFKRQASSTTCWGKPPASAVNSHTLLKTFQTLTQIKPPLLVARRPGASLGSGYAGNSYPLIGSLDGSCAIKCRRSSRPMSGPIWADFDEVGSQSK
jgi:hypothetical protein